MTHVDDLEVGMWIAVSGRIDEPCQQQELSWASMMGWNQPQQHVFDGCPLKIRAISLPFICCQKFNETVTIDVRQCQVTRLSRQYVNAVLSKPPELKPRTRKKKRKPEKGSCPRCGTRLIQRRVITNDPSKKGWFIVCPACDLNQGPAPKERP